MTRLHENHIGPVGLSLCEVVREHPGIHFRALGRAANVSSVGQLRHHLDRLEHQGILVEVEEGGYKRFFIAGAQDPQVRPTLARFSRRVARQIGTLLLDHPMSRTELRRTLGCADSTLGFHLSRMLTQGDLVRHWEHNRCNYELADEPLVRSILQLSSNNGNGGPVLVPMAEENGHAAPRPDPPEAPTQPASNGSAPPAPQDEPAKADAPSAPPQERGDEGAPGNPDDPPPAAT